MSASKEEIRARMNLLQKDFSEVDEGVHSERILTKLEQLPEFTAAENILLYMSIPGEVRTYEFVRKWSEVKNIFLPCVKENGEMELRLFIPGKTRAAYKNIEEPDETCRIISPRGIDLAIIPGVAFARDADGKYFRLGRGKGYYDRLLPKLKCKCIGLCYPYRVLESVPHDAWDVMVGDCLS